MKEVLAKIADSELYILRLLWREKTPLTMTQIRKELILSKGWDSSTIKTLVYRLVDKGALLADKQKTTLYSTLINEQEYNQFATNTFINKLFGGSAKNLVATLVNNKTLSEDDITELRNMFKVGD